MLPKHNRSHLYEDKQIKANLWCNGWNPTRLRKCLERKGRGWINHKETSVDRERCLMTNISRWECKHILAWVKWLHIYNHQTFPGIEWERKRSKGKEQVATALFPREQTHTHRLAFTLAALIFLNSRGRTLSTAGLLSVTICSSCAYWAHWPPVNHCPILWGWPTTVSHPQTIIHCDRTSSMWFWFC